MIKLFLIFVGLLMPSELVWSMSASGLFKSTLGNGYIILQPQIIALSAIILYYARYGLRVKNELFFSGILFLSLGFYEYLVTGLAEGHRLYAFQQLIFGFLYPTLFVFFLSQLNNHKRILFFRYFYIGYSLYLFSAIIVLLLIDTQFKQQINNYGIGGALISLRYQTEESLFSLMLGNANKQSNYLVLGILLAPTLMGIKNQNIDYKSTEILVFRLFTFFAAIILLALFSRIAIFLLPILLYINRHFLFESSRQKAFLFIVASLFIVSFFEVFKTIADYLIFTKYIDGTSQGFLGTGASRTEQWREIITLLSEPDIFLHGLGVGSYGLLIGGKEWSGSHNLFLDHWLASGIYGIVVLTILIVAGIIRSILRENLIITTAYFFFIILAFREYSFSYLYVTSMGGIFFMLIIYLTLNHHEKQHTQT